MTERTRCPVVHIPERMVCAYWNAGWTYIGPSPNLDFAIMQWDQAGPIVEPVDEEMLHVHRAVSALEGRVA